MVHLIADIIFIVFALVMIFIYAKRGFLKSLLHSLKGIIALVVAYLFGGKLAVVIADKFVSEPVRNTVFSKVDALYQDTAGAVNADQFASKFPDFILTDDVKAKIEAAEGSGEALVNSVTDSIATPISNVISSVIGYVLVFAVAFVALWIVVGILDKIVEHFSILNLTNTVLGAVLGALVAAIVLFAVCSVLSYFCAEKDFYANSTLVKFFGESVVLEKIKFLDIGSFIARFAK